MGRMYASKTRPLALLLAAGTLAGCSSYQFDAERPEWRKRAEAQCMARGDWQALMREPDFRQMAAMAEQKFPTAIARARTNGPMTTVAEGPNGRPDYRAPIAATPGRVDGAVRPSRIVALPPSPSDSLSPLDPAPRPGAIGGTVASAPLPSGFGAPPARLGETVPSQRLASAGQISPKFRADPSAAIDDDPAPKLGGIYYGAAGQSFPAGALVPRSGPTFSRDAIRPTKEIDGPSNCGADAPLRISAVPNAGVTISEAMPVNCPTTVAFGTWLRDVVQPASIAHFGQPVASVVSMGSYSCRPMYHRPGNPMSEHSYANAVDVAGFVLQDGTRISLKRDWKEADARGGFLRDVHQGACGIFNTTLGPESNDAHADHFHLDMALRRNGRAICR